MSWTVTIQIPIGSTYAGAGASNALAWKREIVLPDSIKPKQVCCIFWDVYTYRAFGHAYGYLYLDGDKTSESISVTTTKRQWSSSSSYSDVKSVTTRSGVYFSEYNVTQVTLDSSSIVSTNNNYSSANAVFNAIESNVYLGRGNPAAPVARDYFDSQVSKPLYIGVNGQAREVTDMYVGVNGKARKVIAVFTGVNGKARTVFDDRTVKYDTITLIGGKGDQIEIYDGDIIIHTVSFGTDAIQKDVRVPMDTELKFKSTKFKYNGSYFSKTVTLTTGGNLKIMPEGTLYWYGNECTDTTGGWITCPVVYTPLSESQFSGLTPKIVKKDHSIWCGWDSTDLGSVDTNYYYSGGLTTNNKIQIVSGDIGKIHLIKSLYKKESQTNNTVCGGSLITPALSGKVGGYGNDDIVVEYPQSGYTSTPGQTLLEDTIITFPPQSSQIGNQYYLGWGMSVSKHSGELLYSYVEFDYYVMG